MGFAYAIDSFVLIVAEHGPVCIEEIEQLNNKSYRANFNGELNDVLKVIGHYGIEFKDGKYCLKPEKTIKKVKEQHKIGIKFAHYAHSIDSFWEEEMDRA